MTPLQDLDYRPLDSEQPRSALSLSGREHTVPGAFLEGAWQIGSAVLVALTDDLPQEDFLHLSLVQEDGDIETVTIGSAYSTGRFALVSADNHSLSFEFIGDTNWTVTVLDRPERHIPVLGDPKGVSRSFCLSTRLKVKGSPKSDR